MATAMHVDIEQGCTNLAAQRQGCTFHTLILFHYYSENKHKSSMRSTNEVVIVM
jgi:hypothetical protein